MRSRFFALVVLTVGISCGGRTPLYTSDDPAFTGLPANSDPGDQGSGNDNMGRGNSRGGPDDQMTGTGTGGPSTGTAGTSGTGVGVGVGAGGSSSSSGVGGSSSTGAGGSIGVACAGGAFEEMIDDMNDGDRFIPSINGRSGAWTVYHDTTPAKMHPDVNDPFTMESTGDPCRRLAAHVYGGPFSVWGAGFGFGLGSPYNAARYVGISFWGRVAPGSTASLHIAFPDKDTAYNGGLCDPNSTGANSCYDHYSARRLLSDQWQRIEVLFSGLQQLGFGRRGRAFDPTTLYEVQFLIDPNAKFDVWIDDVAFLLQ